MHQHPKTLFMKLIIEKHPELTRLINFFAEVEGLAQSLGLNIDDLNPDRKANTSTLHTSFRQNSKAILRYRTDVLKGAEPSLEKKSKCCSITSLSIHKEE